MVEHGYSYLDSLIQRMTEFFAIRVKNLEKFDYKKESKKNQKKLSNKKNKKRKHSNNSVSKNRNSQGSETGKIFASITVRVDTLPMNAC